MPVCLGRGKSADVPAGSMTFRPQRRTPSRIASWRCIIIRAKGTSRQVSQRCQTLVVLALSLLV